MAKDRVSGIVVELNKTNSPYRKLDPWTWSQHCKSLTHWTELHEDQRDITGLNNNNNLNLKLKKVNFDSTLGQLHYTLGRRVSWAVPENIMRYLQMLLHLSNAYQNWTLFNIYLFIFDLSSVNTKMPFLSFSELYLHKYLGITFIFLANQVFFLSSSSICSFYNIHQRTRLPSFL